MTGWQRFIKAPHTLWLRRALFQVHLWMGIAFGLYVVVISVSGSAVVLRPQFSQWFVHSRVEPAGEALTDAALEERAAQVYAGYELVSAAPSPAPGRAVYVVLNRGGEEYSRFFDQYRGVDLGDTFPWPVRAMEWLTSLHDDLLLGRRGRIINGIGGALFLVMVLSGLFIWWQGARRWKEGLVIRRTSPRGLNWQLHSFLGFWSLLLMFAWGLTAVYFAFPAPFDWLIDTMDGDLEDFERPEGWLLFLIKLHFGRFGNLWGRVAWTIIGLLPAVMFVTGFILWWRRVVRRTAAGLEARREESAPSPVLDGEALPR